MDRENNQMLIKSIDTTVVGPIDKENRTIKFIGATATQDRTGDVIEMDGWILDNFMRNPVFLWSHQGHSVPPIGRALEVNRTPEGLKFTIQFAEPEIFQFADTIFKLYVAGFLKAVSVGFIPKQREAITDPQTGEFVGFRFLKQELVELSAVSVPANPQALIEEALVGDLRKEATEFLYKSLDAEDSFLKTINDLKREILLMENSVEKGVIPFKHYPLADKGTKWDGPAQKREADIPTLKAISAWFDESNPDVKGSYKLPHHLASNKNTVWNGVKAAMGALLGARGGVNIPDGDRRGVYNHLARHYREFDEEPPEFKEYSPEELKELFGTEEDLDNRLENIENRVKQLEDVIKQQKSVIEMQESAKDVLSVVKTLLEGLQSSNAGKAVANPFLKVLAPGNKPEGMPEDPKAILEAISNVTSKVAQWKPTSSK